MAWPEFYPEIRPYHFIFAADNGIVTAGVVQQEQEITCLQASNMVTGGAAISCFCKCQGVPYTVVDVGINSGEAVGLDRKVARGTKNFRCVGGFDLAALCGAMVACYEKKLPFMLDGFITAVALACASTIQPKVSCLAIPTHMSKEPGMLYALKKAV